MGETRLDDEKLAAAHEWAREERPSSRWAMFSGDKKLAEVTLPELVIEIARLRSERAELRSCLTMLAKAVRAEPLFNPCHDLLCDFSTCVALRATDEVLEATRE